MLEKLNNLTINVQKKTPGTKDQLKLFMTEWVLEHILSQDKPLLNPGENTTQAVSFR
jgi:hemerythrin